MADEKRKDTRERGEFPGGGMNSEHESETSGMRRSARIPNPGDFHEFDDDEDRTVDTNPGPPAEEITGRKEPVHRLRTTEYTDVEKEMEKRGERFTDRTPYEMSQHDRINRTPDSTATPKKSAHRDEEDEETSR